ELALEPLGVVAQLVLAEKDLGLALADRLVAGGNPGRFPLEVVLADRQLALPLGELLVAGAPLVLALRQRPLTAVPPGGPRLPVGRDLGLLPRDLLLALVQGGTGLGQLALGLLALAVGALQLAEALLGGLLLLGGERLLGGELGLQVGDPRVLALDHLALVADAPLALLQLDLELGQLRLALVQRRGAVHELLLGADVLLVGLGALLQLVPQRGLALLRGV